MIWNEERTAKRSTKERTNSTHAFAGEIVCNGLISALKLLLELYLINVEISVGRTYRYFFSKIIVVSLKVPSFVDFSRTGRTAEKGP